MKVELIYDLDCPNVLEARTQLQRAFVEARIPAKWTEWEKSSPDSPDYVRGYGSPTILVNGKDVDGVSPSDGISSCRLYQNKSRAAQKTPDVETIASALRSATRSRSGWRGILATVPGVGAAFLPVGACPACWPAYAGLLGSFGLGFLLETAYLLPLTIIFLALALLALGYRANTRRGFLPLAVGFAAFAMILIFKFVVFSNPIAYGGLALLIAASIWNSWPMRPKSSCPACAPKAATSVEMKHVNEKSIT
ncbi:MAG: MerC domain-containing protein [Verrucomicrobia bacterium]|nr:MerC domain-containing protein [Verrucomicrobiota bacterium]MDA1068510.1 MerC domain-containing protein [Verrucomicrobiota bacterium]